MDRLNVRRIHHYLPGRPLWINYDAISSRTFRCCSFSIFLPLFAIASVIFMIKLATYTAVIQLSLAEMGKLYLFVLPELLFYTLPISFFVSGALTLYRLSNDNEMVVVFSLGIPPRFIARVLAAPALLLSLLLVYRLSDRHPLHQDDLGQLPSTRKAEAKFNLSAWNSAITSGVDALHQQKRQRRTRLRRHRPFSKEMKDEILISAKSAELINNNGVLQFRLSKGKATATTMKFSNRCRSKPPTSTI